MFRILLLASMFAALAGCVGSEMIVLKNPATGEIKECSRNSGPNPYVIAQTMADNAAARSCARGYQAAGFVRLN
jgi:hypothetical protein